MKDLEEKVLTTESVNCYPFSHLLSLLIINSSSFYLKR